MLGQIHAINVENHFTFEKWFTLLPLKVCNCVSREVAASSAGRLSSPVSQSLCGTTEWSGLPDCLGAANWQRSEGFRNRTYAVDYFQLSCVRRWSWPEFTLKKQNKKKMERDESLCQSGTARGLIHRVYWQQRNSHSPALFLELSNPPCVRGEGELERRWSKPFPISHLSGQICHC